MKGTERAPDGTLRFFYQYKQGGPKFYYKKKDLKGLRIPFRKPFIPKQPERDWDEPPEYVEYVPKPRLPPLEAEFQKMHPNVQKLITTWLLVFGFANINLVTVDEVKAQFRKLSLIHHPDRGGREESFKELSAVRDHLLTLCAMCAAMK